MVQLFTNLPCITGSNALQ